MSEEFPALFYEIFGRMPRQGPGGDAQTRRALAMIPGLENVRDILDIGCGCGTPTLVLARHTAANIVALDNYAPFLETLKDRAKANGFDRRIRTVVGDMSKPQFTPGSFDLIWSEGAIGIAGFEQGLRTWHPLVRARGSVAVTDLCWFTENPPAEIRDYFAQFYPGMMTAGEYVKSAGRAGYRVLNHFSLPKESWQEGYFGPLAVEIARQRSLHAGDAQSLELLDGLQLESEMYRKYSDHYGYEFVIAQKI